MDCVILNSAVCCENCTNLLLFIWSKPFLFAQQKHLLQTQIATPTSEFSSLLYCYYLNSGTHKQVEVRSFFPLYFPFQDFSPLKEIFHFLSSLWQSYGSTYCKPILSSSNFFSCYLKRTWLLLMTGLFCFRQNPVG